MTRTPVPLLQFATTIDRAMAVPPARFQIDSVGWLTTPAPVPTWVEPSVARLNALLKLPDNWDGEGAEPVNPRVVSPLMTLLVNAANESPTRDIPVPGIVPTVHGGLQVEWHFDGLELEIEAASPDEFIVVFDDRETGASFDGAYPPSASKIKQALHRLVRRT